MAVHDKLGNPNCQRWEFQPFAAGLVSANVWPMGDVVDMDAIRENLRRIMKLKGAKPTSLSLAASDNKNRTLVKDFLEKHDSIRVSSLVKLAGALDVPLYKLVEAPPIPIVGYIGAGGTILFEEFETGETVPRPPSISGTLEALLVQGDSMLPKYKDGDIIYIQKQTYEGLLEDYLGEECAVRLVTGETYLKQLIRGSEAGRFTLISLNAPPIEDVEVEWATPVAFILPARSRLQFS